MASSNGLYSTTGSQDPSMEGRWLNRSQNVQHYASRSEPGTHVTNNQGRPYPLPPPPFPNNHSVEGYPRQQQHSFDPMMHSPPMQQPSSWLPPSMGIPPGMSSSSSPQHHGLPRYGGLPPPPTASYPSSFPTTFPSLPSATSNHQFKFDQVFMTRAPPPPPRPKTPPPPPPKRTAPHTALVPQQIRRSSSSQSPPAHDPKRSHKGGTLKNVSNSGRNSTVVGNNGPGACVTRAISTTDATNGRSLPEAPPLSLAEELQSRQSRKRPHVHKSAEVFSMLSSDEGGSGSGGDHGEYGTGSGDELPCIQSVGDVRSSAMPPQNSSRKMAGFESNNSPHIRNASHESRDVEKARPDDKLGKSTASDGSKPSLAIYPLLEDTAAATQDGPPKVAPTKILSKSRMALELMREKLEQAKQRKLDLQDKLEQQKQAKSIDPPKHAQTTAVPRARARLVGALKNREKALQVRDSQTLPPISALIEDLVITNISQTGTEDMVRIPAGLFDDMGLSDVVAEHDNDLTEAQVQESEDLAARKNKLEQDLGALKLRLERKQKAAMGRKRSQVDGELQGGDINPEKKVKSVLNKEALERRKVEARAFVDVSYWKHFVSKQKHLLAEVTNQVKDNANAGAKCDKELAKISQAIAENASQIEDLEMRQGIVSNMLMNSGTKLLGTRNRLYTQSGVDLATAEAKIEQSPEVTAAASEAAVEHSDLASAIGIVREADTRDDASDCSDDQFADPV